MSYVTRRGRDYLTDVFVGTDDTVVLQASATQDGSRAILHVTRGINGTEPPVALFLNRAVIRRAAEALGMTITPRDPEEEGR